MTELVQQLLVDDADEELGWQERALCAQTDPESFFPEKGGSTREAKKVCLSCEVRSECLEYALANDERFGIWGGLSERERHAAEEGRGLTGPLVRERPVAGGLSTGGGPQCCQPIVWALVRDAPRPPCGRRRPPQSTEPGPVPRCPCTATRQLITTPLPQPCLTRPARPSSRVTW